MNARILDLIKNPDNIQIKDLDILQNEINKFPYVQSLRALHLYGTHLFRSENYPAELSQTAAYTTDKKILYLLINKKSVKSETSQNHAITAAQPSGNAIPSTTEKQLENFHNIPSPSLETPKPVYINGELNRILFEGEEDFLERESEQIDIESTKEAGVLVMQRTEPTTENANSNLSKEQIEQEDRKGEAIDAENFSKEKIVDEDKIQDEKTEIHEESSLSFHATEPFLPEVKIDSEAVSSTTEVEKEVKPAEITPLQDKVEVENSAKKIENTELENAGEAIDAENFSKETVIPESNINHENAEILNKAEVNFHGMDSFLPDVKIASTEVPEQNHKAAPQSNINRHEEEMQRLIAEVEKKLKAARNEKENDVEEEKIVDQKSDQIFEEVKEEVVNTNEKVQDQGRPIEAKSPEGEENSPQEKVEPSSWKPMQLSQNMPDSLISKKEEPKISQPDSTDTEKQTSENTASDSIDRTDVKSEERPVFNVSFFTQGVTPIETKTEIEEVQKSGDSVPEIQNKLDDSNIPTFINTWQNWLKIERKTSESGQINPISPQIQKSKTIENFIENEPKISKLKEESDFVVKEKNDDISHLMTETLANLYVEQKLFSKAIKAYQILIGKYPEKEELFQEKIAEIKELRQNK